MHVHCKLGSTTRYVLASTTLSAKDLEKRLKVRGHCLLRFEIVFADSHASLARQQHALRAGVQ
jgi:hypothetical protein